MESLSNKTFLRGEFRKIRASLPSCRREEAALGLLSLLPFLESHTNILSFASFGHEIDTQLLNRYLANTNRLLLPKTVGNRLKIFRVLHPPSQLIPSSKGPLEPNPQLCEEIDIRKVQIVLVPALGFDQRYHRLGYGKGCYDRFLKNIPHALTIGIGFKEQLIETLPVTANDIPLQKVSLF